MEPTPRPQRRPDFGGIRDRCPRAWAPWTEEEDRALADAVRGGKGVAAFAADHGRPIGAVRSRIRRIGASEGR